MLVKRIASLVLLMVLFGGTSAQAQSNLSVILEAAPADSLPGTIGPDKTLVHTSLTIVDATGQAVPNAFLKLRLDAPASNPILSTDFPVVENTTLLRYEGTLPTGRFEFDYIYPIRGKYNFQVEAGRDAAAPSFHNTLNLDLSENVNEVINLIILVAGLLALGIVAGVVIGNGARAQRMAAMSVVLIALGIGLLSSPPSTVQAQHGEHDAISAEPFTESATNKDLTLTYTMNPGMGEVGTLSHLNFAATYSRGAPVPNTSFAVKFWHVEDKKQVFAANLYAPSGQTQLDFQFFDGAKHEVQLQANSATGKVDLTKVIAVQPIDPPLLVKIKTTLYLVLIAFGGILVGLRFSFNRSKSGREPSPLNAQRSTL
ncbi:MAG: hypothetical protein BroJett011_13850 [Chloroflexota bacterium]|nr:MAG: hypothetical protein BroJett011_13850 [Chloroflexota bacterium]